MPHPIVIVPFRPELAPAFGELNRAWIERLFRMEGADRKVLAHPEEAIIRPGGQIYYAMDGNEPVGTVAAIKVSATTYELAKMAVSPEYRGHGLGERLGRAVVDFAHPRPGQICFALDGEAAVGTAAAIRVTPTTYELAKMAVSSGYRGRGLGERLGGRFGNPGEDQPPRALDRPVGAVVGIVLGGAVHQDGKLAANARVDGGVGGAAAQAHDLGDARGVKPGVEQFLLARRDAAADDDGGGVGAGRGGAHVRSPCVGGLGCLRRRVTRASSAASRSSQNAR